MFDVDTCALCKAPLYEGVDSEEHLIPSSIGGRLKVSGFICKACNSKAGDKWDAELARQLNPLSLLANIKKDRGGTPSQAFPAVGGDKLWLHADGTYSPFKPFFKKTHIEDGFEINIIARNVREARDMLKGVARKHPGLDVDNALEKAKCESFYTRDPLEISLDFGGEFSGRSVVKSVLCLAVKSGVYPEQCEKALSYLLDEGGEACFGYYYESDLIKDRPRNKIFHCIAVEGDPDSGLLLGYAEFYNAYKVVVCLSDDYLGPKVRGVYAINPVDNEELDLTVNLNFDKSDIKPIYNYEKYVSEKARQDFHDFMSIATCRMHEKEQDRVVSDAVGYAFKNCGAVEGEVLTEEHLKKMTDLIMEKMQPYLFHRMSKK